MRSSSRSLIIATMLGWCTATGVSAQSLRDLVRMHGDTTMTVNVCYPLIGLTEIVEFAPFTVEGTITAAQSKLTAGEDEIYTEYEIDVIRVFRGPAASARATPGPTDHSSPFVAGTLLTQPGVTRRRMRLQRRNHGRVVVEGRVVTVKT